MTDTPTSAPRRPRWWLEIMLTLILYGFYTGIRNKFGSDLGEGAKQAAIDNADRIIRAERSVHLFIESGVQELFLDWDWFIVGWNLFYGFMHFAATIGTMVYLFLVHPKRYLRWRSVLLTTTVLALIGFATFPLMPPRLLNDCHSPFGACNTNYDFVDTLVDPGGFWSFDSGTMQEISNQYAAMPSLHVGWALWVTLALFPVVRHRWVRGVVIIYPLLTMFAIVVTGNHYWIDALGGAATLGVGYLIGQRIEPWLPGIPASLDPGPPIEERAPAPLQEC